MYFTAKDIKPRALYSRVEVSRILGISISTVYRLRSRGLLKPVFIQASTRPMYLGKDILTLYKAGPSKLLLL